MKAQRKLLFTLLGLAVLCAGFVVWKQSAGNKAPNGRKIAFYQDSMHPWIKSDRPGKCTICVMDLTPIYEGDQGFTSGANVVVLSSNNINVLNVQTEEVREQALSRVLRVAGTLEANETRRAVLSAPAPGRIQEVEVAYTGVQVAEGQNLISIVSAELIQKRAFIRAANVGKTALTNDLAQTSTTGSPFSSVLVAPLSGTVVERAVVPGQYVLEGDKLLTIIDSSTLWFRFDVYQRQLPWFQPGQRLEVTVDGIPGKVFPAVISFIEPTLNDATRTLKVRADIENPLVGNSGQRLLRFGMYAEGRVRAVGDKVVVVPRSAILFPGGAAYAYVDKGEGAYERRRVKLGRQGDEVWEVLDGLEEGDRVVTSGNVLIDAQAQFSRGTEMELDSGDAIKSPDDLPTDPEPRQQVSVVNTTGLKTVHQSHNTPAAESKPAADEESAPESTETAERVMPVSGDRWSRNRLETGYSRMAQNEQMRAKRLALLTEAYVSGGGTLHSGAKLAPSGTRYEELVRIPQAQPGSSGTNSPAILLAAAKPTGHAGTPPNPVAASQRKALQSFFSAADALSRALAADNVQEFNLGTPAVAAAAKSLQKEVSAAHPWGTPIQKIADIEWRPAKDLADARKQFLPFSTLAVELAKPAKKQEADFKSLKLYHCPMAPKPGVWLQLKAPLRNPFFGSEMLECGTEVKP